MAIPNLGALTSGFSAPTQSGALAGVFNAALGVGSGSSAPPSNGDGRASGDPLQLGRIKIENFEAPEELAISISKAIAVHDFPGGEREVQDYDWFYDPIRWQGCLFGDTAENRARQLETLARDQAGHILQWRGYRLNCVITHFVATPKNAFDFDYEIEVLPISNQNTEVSPKSSPESIINWSFQQAQQRIAGPPAVPEIQEYKQTIQDFQNLIDQNLRQAQGQIGNIDPTVRLILATSAANISAGLNSLILASPGAAVTFSAGDLRTYMTVIQNTLTEPEKRVTVYPVMNPNLATVASMFYGDPSLWTIIKNSADSKTFKDMVLTGYYVLLIPSVPAKPKSTQPIYR